MTNELPLTHPLQGVVDEVLKTKTDFYRRVRELELQEIAILAEKYNKDLSLVVDIWDTL